MPPLTVRQFPDPILRRISEPISKSDSKLRALVNRLIETMGCQSGGIGIAAPQIGIPQRVAIVDVSSKISGAKLIVLINPVIIGFFDENIFREGCMSLPDFTANVKRAEKVKVKFQDINLESKEIAASGLEARCIQHEIDHLNGLLFVDRVVSLKSDVFRRRRYL